MEREERTATQGCNRNVDVLLIILTVSDRLVVRLQPNVSLRSTRGGVIGRQAMSSSSSAVLERKVLSRPTTRVEVSKEKLNPTHY